MFVNKHPRAGKSTWLTQSANLYFPVVPCLNALIYETRQEYHVSISITDEGGLWGGEGGGWRERHLGIYYRNQNLPSIPLALSVVSMMPLGLCDKLAQP